MKHRLRIPPVARAPALVLVANACGGDDNGSGDGAARKTVKVKVGGAANLERRAAVSR